MKQAITTKAQMYELLRRGQLGNTIPQYFDPLEWIRSADFQRIGWWGVRTMVPGGPCRLNCPRDEVVGTARSFQEMGHTVNISCMIDKITTVTAWLEVWDSPGGWVVEGVEYPQIHDGWTWRNSMQHPDRRKAWSGTAARMILARHMNANSREDLDILLAEYPGHVVEFSACETCLGDTPGRNCVVWEVRNY